MLNQILNILLIDDNPDDRLLVIRQLKREFSELKVEQVLDLKDLHQALDAHNFDLVITDYELGWSNGIEVLHAIKERYADCPVIMFTNSGNEEIAVEAMKGGVDDYIIKSPKHYIRVARAVRSVLEQVGQRQALQEAENRYRRLFEGVPVGLYRTTPSGQLEDVNPTLVQMLGYPNQQSLLTVRLVDLYLKEQTRQQWLALIEQEGVVRNFEVELLRSDGTIIWVLHSARAIQDSNAQLLYYEGALEDITAAKRIESERAQLLLREQAANRIKDEFLATLSHELRTPLNAILGWAGMLRTRNFDETTVARALEAIERNAVAQTKLVEALLDISRIVRGQMKLDIRPIDLGIIIQTAIDTMRTAADAKKLEIDYIIDPAARNFIGDPDRLQQILWNILSNAIKFSSSGGQITVELSLGLNPNSEYVQIQVSDTGIGIAPEVMSHIFERFHQADSSTTRVHGGLGLGLAIVKQLVELHGGRVFAQSGGVGKGATFTMQLPMVENSSEFAAENRQFAPSPSGILDGLQVLVVDDNTDSLEYITIVLEDEGALVKAVTSVAEALLVLEQQSPDVLISDIGMPVADGYSLIRQVRSQEAERRASGVVVQSLPAIALTAYAREEDRVQACAAGFQHHLAKPIEPSELVMLVTNLSGRNHNF